MRVLVFGAAGQVGAELMTFLPTFAEAIGVTRGDLDLEDLAAVRRAIAHAEPDVIVNAASYNDVDGAEKDEERARQTNGHAVAAMGEEARRRRALLIHYSTDFVFDGHGARPYVETDPPAPLSAYGRSKLLGETLLAAADAPAIVFRTAWVYSIRRKSFVSSILRAARAREVLGVVEDQVGCPTWARDLALATALVLRGAGEHAYDALADLRGVYHLAGAGQTSRCELARAIVALDPLRSEHLVREIQPIPTAELALPAARPAHAPLDCTKSTATFRVTLPDWRISLERCLSDLDLGRLVGGQTKA